MNQLTPSREPEYSVEELGKTPHTEKLLACINPSSITEVEAELHLLYQELSISTDILGKIRDSVRVLALSVGEQ